MEEKIKEFWQYLNSELAFVNRYLNAGEDWSSYYDGKADALANALTEFELKFEKELKNG